MSALSGLQALLLIVQLTLSMAIFATCFCRLQKTNLQTVSDVVLAFWAKAVMALLLAGAPFLPLLLPADCHWPAGTTPIWMYLAFMAASLAVQVTTAVHWRHGVPLVFVKKGE